jgi:uncharacterized protein
MFVVEIRDVPPEGIDVDEALSPEALHLDGNEGFALQEGGRLRCHLARGEAELVQVTGTLAAGLALECGRCLEPFVSSVAERLDLVYLPVQSPRADEDDEDVDLGEDDMVVVHYTGGRIDLGEMVRGQLVLSVPMRRVCREECRGLCSVCGANRNSVACGCVEAPQDARVSPFASALARKAAAGHADPEPRSRGRS